MPDKTDAAKIERIYLNSFPPDERRPWTDIIDVGQPRLSVIRKEGKAVGMLSWWDFGRFVYIEHFAMDNSLRGHGFGAHVLQQFVAGMMPVPVVLECEPPQLDEMARRRFGFYLRNGFEVLTSDYIQPPYGPGLSEVPLYIMTSDGANTPDADQVAGTLKREVYKSLSDTL